MRFTDIVYLDPLLVSEAFTEITGSSPVTNVTRSRDISGGLGVGVLQLGGATSESREYAVSSTQMFFQIEAQLRVFQKSRVPDCFRAAAPIWLEGQLCVGKHNRKVNGEVAKEVHQFCLATRGEEPDAYITLVTNDAFFSSGYDQLAVHKDLLGTGMWEPVEALLRPIFYNGRIGVHQFTPFVILRRKNGESGSRE